MPEELGVHEFSAFFSDIFGRLWQKYRFPVPADDELPAGVLEVLAGEETPDKLAELGGISPGMVWMFERAWARIYGTVTLEVFGHVHPGFITTGALFQATVLDIGQDLGLAGEWDRLQAIARG